MIEDRACSFIIFILLMIAKPNATQLPPQRITSKVNLSKVCGKMNYIEAEFDNTRRDDNFSNSPKSEFYFKLSDAVSRLK